MNDGRSKIDYSGRTVDLLLLKTVLCVPVVNKRVDLDVSETPMVVTGVEKMVQRYAMEFINAIGSAKFRPEYGTSIVPDVARGLIYDMSTLRTAAAMANLSAARAISIADSLEDTKDDERLVSSDVYHLEFSRSSATIRIFVRLTNAAGNSYEYIIPVETGVH